LTFTFKKCTIAQKINGRSVFPQKKKEIQNYFAIYFVDFFRKSY